MATYRNGVTLPTKETFSIIPTIANGDVNIAAIDFGTTACSLAYCFQSTAGSELKDRQVVKVKLDGQEYRVPSAILMNDNGEILGFGKRALSEYAKELTHCNGLFQHIKMELQHDSVSVYLTNSACATLVTFCTCRLCLYVYMYVMHIIINYPTYN